MLYTDKKTNVAQSIRSFITCLSKTCYEAHVEYNGRSQWILATLAFRSSPVFNTASIIPVFLNYSWWLLVWSLITIIIQWGCWEQGWTQLSERDTDRQEEIQPEKCRKHKQSSQQIEVGLPPVHRCSELSNKWTLVDQDSTDNILFSLKPTHSPPCAC